MTVHRIRAAEGAGNLGECVSGVALVVCGVGVEAVDVVHDVEIPALVEPKVPETGSDLRSLLRRHWRLYESSQTAFSTEKINARGLGSGEWGHGGREPCRESWGQGVMGLES